MAICDGYKQMKINRIIQDLNDNFLFERNDKSTLDNMKLKLSIHLDLLKKEGGIKTIPYIYIENTNSNVSIYLDGDLFVDWLNKNCNFIYLS